MSVFDKFAKNLNIMLKDLNISQVEFSKRTGIPRTTISAYLNQTNEPTLTNIYKITKELNCTFEDLVE